VNTRNPEEQPARWPFKPLKVPKSRKWKIERSSLTEPQHKHVRSEALERHLAKKELQDGGS
jgi:hypothetical protein